MAGPYVDTLALARQRYPGAPASLDALCRRFELDLSVRSNHGAKIDCDLLAEVYLELLGGRQPDLDLAAPAEIRRQRRPHRASAAAACAIGGRDRRARGDAAIAEGAALAGRSVRLR